MSDIVTGRRANTPGAIIQDDLGESYGLTGPLGLLLEWHQQMNVEVVSWPPLILTVHGTISSPFGIGVFPGAWRVSNIT